MVSTFCFQQIVHNCHRFDCIVTSHCIRTTFCKMTNSDDNIKWVHHHCSSTYNWLETAVSMVEMATFTIKHINRLFISNVSEKVKSDFFRIIIEYSKANAILLYSTFNQSLRTFLIYLKMMNSIQIILRHNICPYQLMSQNNHLPWQIFLSKALC